MKNSRFVDKELVPVYLEESRPLNEQDVIYIRAKMSYGVKQRLTSKAAHISMGSADGKTARASADVGAYQLAILTFNVVRWTGPSFDGVPCIDANIEDLDPDDPLVEKVLEEIERRNTKAPSPNPQSTIDGSEPLRANGTEPSEVTISTSD